LGILVDGNARESCAEIDANNMTGFTGGWRGSGKSQKEEERKGDHERKVK
jgi:hypothetical protein